MYCRDAHICRRHDKVCPCSYTPNSSPTTHQPVRQHGGTGKDGHIRLADSTLSVAAIEKTSSWWPTDELLGQERKSKSRIVRQRLTSLACKLPVRTFRLQHRCSRLKELGKDMTYYMTLTDCSEESTSLCLF